MMVLDFKYDILAMMVNEPAYHRAIPSVRTLRVRYQYNIVIYFADLWHNIPTA
jgi:hypothetical protein